MFQLPPEYQTKLDELGLSYRLAHQSANLIRDKWTGKFDEDPEQDKRRIKCEIVEIGTNKAIGIESLGMDEPSAVIAAVDLIPAGYKSSSPAAALSEMAELRAKLAKYEAAEAEQPTPKPAKKGK